MVRYLSTDAACTKGSLGDLGTLLCEAGPETQRLNTSHVLRQAELTDLANPGVSAPCFTARMAW